MNQPRITSHEVLDSNRDAMQPRGRLSIRSPLVHSLATGSSQLATRRAVTLIELLITITIIATLSATFLGVSRSAMESARGARTKTMISKLHGLLMEKWASYTTRRADFDKSEIIATFPNRRDRGWALADLRLLALRELMTVEMPDSWSDILQNPVRDPATNPERPDPRILGAYPALRSIYLRRFKSLPFATLPGSIQEKIDRIEENQGAECLYMIIMLSTADGEARSLFSEQDIGDTDQDGAPEFLDGWGRPIHFIRWPAGFAPRSDLMAGDADSDHDAFDVFRRDQSNAPRPNTPYPITSMPALRDFVTELSDGKSAFRLVPLIYSAGPDGETDIDDLPYFGGSFPTSLDPYAVDPSPSRTIFEVGNNGFKFIFGLPTDMNNDGDDNSLDNIHNHLLDSR